MLMILAYLDPGSGSLLMQVILGGLAGIATIFVTLRRRITGLFSRRPKKEPTTTDDSGRP